MKFKKHYSVRVEDCLYPYYTEALKVIKESGIKIARKPTTVKTNGRLGETLGRSMAYTDGHFEIEIGRRFVNSADHDRIVNVMIHELLHVIDGNKSGHDGRWRELANRISRLSDHKITKYASGLKPETLNAVYPYAIKCMDCGESYGRYSRRCKTWKEANGKICPSCGGKIRSITR